MNGWAARGACAVRFALPGRFPRCSWRVEMKKFEMKKFGSMRGRLALASVPVLAGLSGVAGATDIYSDIAGAVSFTPVIVGVGLVAVAIAAVLVAKKGAHLLLGFLGR